MDSQPRPHPQHLGRGVRIIRQIQKFREYLGEPGPGKPRNLSVNTVIDLSQASGLAERLAPQRLLWWAASLESRYAPKIRRFFERWPGRLLLHDAKRLYMRVVVKEMQQLALLEKSAEIRERLADLQSSPFLNPFDRARLVLRCEVVTRRETDALESVDRLVQTEGVQGQDFAEAMRICDAIGSPQHTQRVAALWARRSSRAFEDRYVRQIVLTLPDVQDAYKQLPAGRDDERQYFPELLMPKLCRAYRARDDYQKGLIVQVTSSLGPGGAERQFVNVLNVLKGAAEAGKIPRQPVAIVYRARRRGEAGFFLPDLLRTHLRVHEAGDIPRAEAIEVLQHQSNNEVETALNLMELLPRNIQQSVLRYYFLLMEEKPEIVQIWQDDTNILCGIAALLAGVPKIFFFTRSKRPIKFTRHRRYLRSCYRDFLRLPNVKMLNNSLSGAADYAVWLDLPRESVFTVYNGIDIEAFAAGNTDVRRQRIRAELGIPPDALVVGGVMRMSSEKEPLLWLDVSLRLAERHPAVHFICLGDGPLFKEMREKIEASVHRSRFHLPGATHGVAPWIGIMTLVLCTSSVEGLPNIPIEAQGLGVAVVATDAGGTRETFVDGEGGYLCPIGNADALVAAAERILSDPAWRLRARERGIAECRSKFDLGVVRDRLLTLYGFQMGRENAVQDDVVATLKPAIEGRDPPRPRSSQINGVNHDSAT